MQKTTCRWRWGWAIGGTLGALTTASLAQPAAPSSTSYAVPDTCPEEAWFRAELQRRLGERRGELTSDTVVAIDVELGDGGYVGHLWLAAPALSPAKRTISHESCEQVLRALALVAAVLLERDNAPTTSASEPQSTTEILGLDRTQAVEAPVQRPPAANPPVLVRTRAPRWRLNTGPLVALGLHSAVAPEPLLGPRIGWTLGLREPSGHGAVFLSLSALRAHSGTAQYRLGEASFTWTSGRVELVRLWDLGRRLSVGPLLFVDAGELKGEGKAALTGAVAENAWLINPGLAGWLEGRIVGPLMVYALAGAFVPVRRPWFYFTNRGVGAQSEEIHRVPGVGATADLGLSVRFP